MKTKFRQLARTITVYAAFVCGVTAKADLTPIIDNPFEPNQQRILDQVYGGDFLPDGANFENGTVAAIRVDDADDQIFPAPSYSATALARFSSQTQEFGNIVNGAFVKSFDVTGDAYDVVGTGTVSGGELGRNGTSGLDSSIPADSVDNRDHLITYEIRSHHQSDGLLLFWEDAFFLPGQSRKHSWWDFNDLVIAMKPIPSDIGQTGTVGTVGTGTTHGVGGNGGGGGGGGAGNNPPPSVIPMPPAVYTGAITALVAMFATRSRKTRVTA